MKSLTHLTFSILTLALLGACGGSGEKPTKEDVENALRKTWEKPAMSASPRTALQVDAITFGSSDKPTEQEVVDGIPRTSTVTAAKVDFTVRQYYTNTTQVVRRVREAHVYKDKFGEWAVMTGQALKDETTEEPAVK
jgi:hypothetical protein